MNRVRRMRTGLCAVMVLSLTGAPAAWSQVQIKTGNCSPKTVVLEDRVACFVKVREYEDADGLLDLVSRQLLAAVGDEILNQYQRFLATPGESREARIRATLKARMPGSDPDSGSVAILDEAFAIHEQTALSALSSGTLFKFLRPVVASLYLWNAPGGFTLRTVETEIVNRTDSTAKLYLTQRMSASLRSQDYNVERRFVFLWKRELGNWYLDRPPE